ALVVFCVLLRDRARAEFLPAGRAREEAVARATSARGPGWSMALLLAGSHVLCLVLGLLLASLIGSARMGGPGGLPQAGKPLSSNPLENPLFPQEGSFEATALQGEGTVNFPFPYAIPPNVVLSRVNTFEEMTVEVV